MERLEGYFIATALALLTFVTAIASGAETFHPDTRALHELELQGSTWLAKASDYEIRLGLLDRDSRQAYLRDAGSIVDPFASRPDSEPRFLTFLLEVRNVSNGEITFQTENCWLSTNKRQVLYPVGIEGLRAEYSLMDRTLPPAYDRARPAVFDGSRTIAPGQGVSGLLVYHAVKPKTKVLVVDVQLSLPGGDIAKISAPYRRRKAP